MLQTLTSLLERYMANQHIKHSNEKKKTPIVSVVEVMSVTSTLKEPYFPKLFNFGNFLLTNC